MNAVGAAKSQLNQFYQRCKSPLPRYDVKQAGSGFKCTIICPFVYTSEGAVELQLFTGKGATKKASQAAAAAEAVKFLQDQPLFAAKKPFVESLWETVKGSLSDQSLFKENELEAYVILAQLCHAGWLPLQQLLPAKFVRAWFKEYEPQAALHPAQALQVLSAKLSQQNVPSDDLMALSEDGKYIKRKATYQRSSAAELGFCKATKAVEISLDLASASKPGGVLVPADLSAPVSWLEHAGTGDPWHAIAKALSVDAHDLLFCEKLAKTVHVPKLPGFQPEDKPQLLLEAFESALGPPINAQHADSPAGPTEGPPTPQPGQKASPDSTLNSDANTPVLPSEALHPPVMYSSTTQTSTASSLNARASWLAGRPVHGDAFLTHSKIRHNGWLVPAVVVNADFTLKVFWQWVHGLLPEVEHVNRAANALVSRLPAIFRHPKAWWGQDPWRLLSELCTPGLCMVNPPAALPVSVLATLPAATQSAAKPESADQTVATQLQLQQETKQVGEETLHFCTLQVTMRGTGQLLTASAQHSSEANTAKQQAALDMVHQLQQAILAMLTASQPDKALVTPMQTSTDHTSTLDMTVLHEGDAENSMPEIGNVVKVQYQLVLDPARKQETSVDAKPELEVQESNSTNPEDHGATSASNTEVAVEQCGIFRFEWGGGGTIPELPAAVHRLGTAGKATVPMSVPLGGPELLMGACPWLHCSLHMTYLGHRYPVSAAPTAPLFDPPLSLQRHALVAGVLEQSGVKRVVDLGCGEGKLLEHLIRSQDCPSLKQMVGLDIAGEAVQRASRKLVAAYKQAADPLSGPLQQWQGLAEGGAKLTGGPVSKQLPSSQLFHGDIATASATKPEFWGDLASIDGAALVEVVEHLDPTPLHNLGPCLLGGLQPKVLVVTTPNREYNAVLHQLGNALLPNKLRNTDHRFEWTRQEFEEWSKGVAEKHGYTVKFWGAGKAMHEGKALSALGVQGKDLGFASQAAVFRRKAGEVQGRGHIGAPGEPVSSTPFGRLVGDIDSSGEPQVMMGSKRPSPRHQSPDPVDPSSAVASSKRVRIDRAE
ncbi:hypothetical protein WJX82_010839 [Trebouxia sp. C0006]